MPIRYAWKPQTALVRAGTLTTDGNGVGSVVFAVSFDNTNYAITFACEGSVDTVIATWTVKTVNGFDVKTVDDKGVKEANAIVNWIAVHV